MISLPILLAAVALYVSSPVAQTVPVTCDADCSAALSAALDWVLKDLERFAAQGPYPLRSPYLDSSRPEAKEGDAMAAREWKSAVRRAAVVVAAGMGIEATSSHEHEAWRTCLAAPESTACRSHVGTTRLRIQPVERLSREVFRVGIGFDVIKGSSEEPLGFDFAVARGAFLRIVKRNGGWQVEKVEVRTVS